MTEGFIFFFTNSLTSFSLLVEIFALLLKAFPIINSFGLYCIEMTHIPFEKE
jgi:hypothetical protein